MERDTIIPVEVSGVKYLTVEDAALLSGMKAATIYQNIDRGNLTSRRILGRVVVPMDEVLERWVENGTAEVTE